MTDFLHKRRAPILDGRLSAAMELGGQTRFFADIGADHGRLSAVLLLADPGRYGLVADISAAALSKARARISQLKLEDRVCFAVANGLDALDVLPDKKPDTIFVLGMGGDTVSGILQRGVSKLQNAALVLGAQTEVPLVRQTLVEIGYRIRKETIASENNRDYVLIRAEKASPNEPCYSEEEILLGPCLLRDAPLQWHSILTRRRRLLTQAIDAMCSAHQVKDENRLQLFQRELCYINTALLRFESQEGGSTPC